MAKLKLLYLAQKGEDKTVIWLAWALAEEEECPAITSKADFPDDIESFRCYTDRLRPRGGKAVLWFVLLIACDGNPDNMTSTVTSTMNWWYKDNHSACYLYDVQDLDDAVEVLVGTLAFSGVHCDHFRLAQVLDPIFRSHNGGAQLKFGVTVKMSKGYPKNEGNFNFPKDRLTVVSADRMDAQPVWTILYLEFNCHPDPLQRPASTIFAWSLPQTWCPWVPMPTPTGSACNKSTLRCCILRSPFTPMTSRIWTSLTQKMVSHTLSVKSS